MKRRLFLVIIFVLSQLCLFSQSIFETAIKGGELLLSGLSMPKVAKSDGKRDSKVIEACVIKTN
jgi:hypothetical protein